VLAWLSVENETGEVDRIAGPVTLNSGKAFSVYSFDLSHNANWKGTIREMRIDFQGTRGVFVEIDSMGIN
jgi:hypothetical protein